ncbi:MAG: carboxypeptidase regulatory-like domain-containing protein [Chitinophagaceae bacterium]|nr:carboxypeptidase regulatory-like domain-containing protein [Chitinophagaceae bacterium]MEA3425545.1 carboxypeptidase regulatory-like domain-containing protein [Bacteroidota bacterium]MCA6453832.1 carboxypeptidase regulatory-like domain-containing protein [Chitinophagaceae bacterium]MCA6456778.1 carboxypeptidase regulatory-like domain-containing protein [Chitinophagaceae bacterium]MCA6460327.1 carboxypeptidase regulatory-like domain-containing protein [Chitinophagaceae bacterium]
MKHILFLVLAGCLAILGCSSAKKVPSAVITQGISGRVTELTGNRMPMKDAEPDLPKPILTTVFIYEPTHISQVTRTGTEPVYTAIATRLVASVDTDSTGHFTISLPVGSYSLFVKQGGRFYANLFDNNNNIALFTVEEGKLTQVTLSVSSRASF